MRGWRCRWVTGALLACCWGLPPALAAQTPDDNLDADAGMAEAPSDQDDETPMQPLDVNAIGERPGSAADGYRARRGTLGAFGELSIKQIPFSLNVTPSELWENRNAHTEQEILQTNPTVSNLLAPLTPGVGGMSRTMVRGNTMGDQGVLRDGLVDRSFTYPWFENVERVEVMNGLSSLLNGFGTVGGTINYVSKRPTAQQVGTVSLGNYGGGINYVTGDVGGPIPWLDSPKLLARTIIHKEAGTTFVTGSVERRSLISTVVTAKPTDNIEVGADFAYQDFYTQGMQNYIDVNPGKGIHVPRASLLDPTKQYGQDWTFGESTKVLAGAFANARLSDIISIRAAYRYGTMWRRYNTTFGTFTDNGGNYSEKYVTTPKQRENTQSYYALADAHFDTWKIKHTITAGYNGTSFYYQRGNDVASDLGMSNLETPLVVAQEPARTSGKSNAQRTWYDSFILGDRAVLGPVSMILGINYAQIRAKLWTLSSNCTTGNQCPAGGLSDTVQGAFTPSVGLVYRPLPELAVYGSYMEGLSPGTTAPMNTTNAYELMPPTHSSQFEVGAKWDLSRTQWTLALFRIDQINEFVDMTDMLYKQDGRQVNYGAELTVSGQILPGLSAVGGATLLRDRVTKASSEALQDKVPVNVPQATGRAFLEYALPFVRTLYINAGANINGSRYVDAANTDSLNASVTFDAGARYELKAWGHDFSASFFVANLANQRYWAYYRAGSGLLSGAPRTFSLSVKAGLW